MAAAILDGHREALRRCISQLAGICKHTVDDAELMIQYELGDWRIMEGHPVIAAACDVLGPDSLPPYCYQATDITDDPCTTAVVLDVLIRAERWLRVVWSYVGSRYDRLDGFAQVGELLCLLLGSGLLSHTDVLQPTFPALASCCAGNTAPVPEAGEWTPPDHATFARVFLGADRGFTRKVHSLKLRKADDPGVYLSRMLQVVGIRYPYLPGIRNCLREKRAFGAGPHCAPWVQRMQSAPLEGVLGLAGSKDQLPALLYKMHGSCELFASPGSREDMVHDVVALCHAGADALHQTELFGGLFAEACLLAGAPAPRELLFTHARTAVRLTIEELAEFFRNNCLVLPAAVCVEGRSPLVMEAALGKLAWSCGHHPPFTLPISGTACVRDLGADTCFVQDMLKQCFPGRQEVVTDLQFAVCHVLC